METEGDQRGRSSRAPRAGAPRSQMRPLVVGAVVLVAAAAGTIVHFALSHSDLKPAKIYPASPAVLAEIAHVTPAIENAVGIPSTVSTPAIAKGEPSLRAGRRPAALYVGAEFCPYCAAERWAIIMTFDRFGTFGHLSETTSSPWDTDPRTPTFTFYRAHYSSRYVTLLTVEHEGNDSSGAGTHHVLQPLTPLEGRLWSRYSAHFGEAEQFPFFDVGNEAFVIGASYDPGVLAGRSQAEIAADLKDPSAISTRDIVGEANYLTAAVCSVTGSRPGAVCSVAAVRRAARKMGIGALRS